MELIGTICELSTPGRWGRANRIDVTVRDSFQIENGRTYLLVENPGNRERFLLTAKYDRDQINDLEPKKLMMIVVGKEKDDGNTEFFTRNSEIKDFFFYAGDGLLQIVDEELKNLRNQKNTDGGVMDQLQAQFKKWMGMG